MKDRCRSLLLVVLSSWMALALLFIATRALAESAAAPAATAEAARAPNELAAAVVKVDGHALFRVRGTSSASADTRAEDIGNRISAAAADPEISPDSVTVAETEYGSQILAEGQPLIMIQEPDARLLHMTRQQVAHQHLASIRNAIVTYRAERTSRSLLQSALLALAATAAALLVFGVLGRLRRRLEAVAHERFQKRISSLRPEQALRTEQVWKPLGTLLRAAGWLVALILLVVYAQFVFGLFPWTRGLATQLLGYLIDPLRSFAQAAIDFIPNFIFLGILALVTRLVLRILALLAESLHREAVKIEGFDPDWAWPTYRIVRTVVIVFAVVVAYPSIPGSNTEAFKGVSIFVGLLISLGSTSVVGNLLSGYTMIYRRAFRVGDRVQIEGVLGEVTAIRVMVTHLRTPKNEEVVIPNSSIINSSVINYTALAKKGLLIMHTTVGVGYETPWRQVEAMLLMAAARTKRVLQDPKPFMLQRGLGDFAIKYELNAYTNDATGMLTTYDELHRNILDAFNEFGVQIMTPAYVKDPADAKVVPKAKWFAAPAQPPGASATSASPASGAPGQGA